MQIISNFHTLNPASWLGMEKQKLIYKDSLHYVINKLRRVPFYTIFEQNKFTSYCDI